MKVIFLDRDGVLNEDTGYLYKISDWKFTVNCIKALKQIVSKGYQIIIITNQSGIARGYYSQSDYSTLTQWYVDTLQKESIPVLDVFHCPHHPEGSIKSLSITCQCRKPEIGMIQQACEKYEIDLEASILVGDRESDVEAGFNAGIKTLVLLNNEQGSSESNLGFEVSTFNNLYQFCLTL